MELAVKRVKRADSWTDEQERQLAEIVLAAMRRGQTQSDAFVEAARALGRTPSACGYRWNGILRKRHREEIAEIRRQRLEAMAWAGGSRDSGDAVERAIRSLRRQEQACARLERRIAEMSEAVSRAVERIRLEIEALEAERRRTAADSPAPGEE